MEETNNGLVVILCALFLILGGCVGGLAFSSETENIVITEKLVMQNCTEAIQPDYVMTQSDFEEKAEEAVALDSAVQSVESRDFKKAVFDALVLYGEDIESYKDITSISYEYDVEGDEVEFDKFKVRYFIDGDEDESEKALLEDFTVSVDDLDFDELEDAEVNEDYMDNLSIAKVY